MEEWWSFVNIERQRDSTKVSPEKRKALFISGSGIAIGNQGVIPH
jgi:hypothetical protein